MSVPKSRRNESKIEFDATYFKVMKDAVELTANHFGASENTYINNKLYTDITCKSILECAESLLVKIRIANSIYPQSYEDSLHVVFTGSQILIEQIQQAAAEIKELGQEFKLETTVHSNTGYYTFT